MLRLLLATSLTLACTTLPAQEVSRQSANGGNDICPKHHLRVDKAEAKSATAGSTTHPAASRTAPVAKPITQRSGDGGGHSNAADRWHSFLPGMFR